MKNIKIIFKLLSILLILFINTSIAKNNKQLPNIDLKTINGEIFNSSTINNNGKPFIINFWATWCKPCIKELNAIDKVYKKWQDKTGVKIFAVSIDAKKNSKRVVGFVKSRGWDYKVLLDSESKFFKAMKAKSPPATFLFDGNGNLVWEHNGYATGGENEIFKQILKILK